MILDSSTFDQLENKIGVGLGAEYLMRILQNRIGTRGKIGRDNFFPLT